MRRFFTRIAEKSADPHTAPVLIVAFGDSVTQGMTALGEQAPDFVYHARLKRMLEAEHKQATFSLINAGQSGQSAQGALASLPRDVLRHQPDLTLISFGLNDAWGGEAGLTPFRAALAAMIAQVRGASESDLILLTPTFMNRADNARVAAEHRELAEPMAALMNSGMLARYADAVRDVARAHGIPLADVYAAWQVLADGGTDTDAMLANGLNHPDAEAHGIAAGVLWRVITGANPA